MFKFKMKKKIIPVIAMMLLVIMAGNAFAIADDNYADFWWRGQLGTNSINYNDSNETRLIQKRLTECLIGTWAMDGDFGNQTRAGVIQYQQTHDGLDPDGIVGYYTWDSFQKHLSIEGSGSGELCGGSYYTYSGTDGETVAYRHYYGGYWYVYGNGNWYHFN